jgi:hypothetical protein
MPVLTRAFEAAPQDFHVRHFGLARRVGHLCGVLIPHTDILGLWIGPIRAQEKPLSCLGYRVSVVQGGTRVLVKWGCVRVRPRQS